MIVESRAILLPLFVQILLTVTVLGWLFYSRVKVFKVKKLKLQQLATRQDSAQQLASTIHIGDNFANQFELPVLFYALVIVNYLVGTVDSISVILSWVFAVSRIAHAYIHCTNNRVTKRFQIFAIGFLSLVLLLVKTFLAIVF